MGTSMPSPSTKHMHSEIIQLGIKLGYFKANSKGACMGVAMAWISACLTDKKQQKKYLRLTEEITAHADGLYEKIKAVQDKVSKNGGASLNKRERELFQYLAFYDQIALYLQARLYPDFFENETVFSQHHIESISKLANSAPLDAKGGLSDVSLSTGIFTKNELVDYLHRFAQAIPPNSGPIGLILTSPNHAIGLSYNSKTKAWQFMDINQGGPQTLDLESIADGILDGFNIPVQTPSPAFTAFSTQVISADTDLKKHSLKQVLASFNNEYFNENRLRHLLAGDGGENLLWLAATSGDIEMVRKAITAGADVNQLVANKSPLYMAAQNGHTEVVKLLLEQPNISVNLSKESPALIAAGNHGHIDIVKALLAHPKILVNEANKDGLTPLQFAAAGGQMGFLNELLLHKSIDINLCIPPKGKTALFRAVIGGHLEVVNKLLSDPRTDRQKFIMNGMSLLDVAAYQGHLHIVDRLIQEDCIPLNKQSRTPSQTPLHIAAENGQVAMVNKLLEIGFDLNQEIINDGRTPLCFAAEAGQLEMVRALLAKPNINKEAANLDGLNILHLAAKNGHVGVVNYLLNEAGFDINVRTNNSSNALQLAAENGHLAVVEALLAHPDQKRNPVTRYDSPIYLAAKNGHIDVFVKLLEDGFDMNCPGKGDDHRTPLKVLLDQFTKSDLQVRQPLDSTATLKMMYTQVINGFVSKACQEYSHNPEKLKQIFDFFKKAKVARDELSANPNDSIEDIATKHVLSMAEKHFSHEDKLMRILLDVIVGVFTAGVGLLVKAAVTGSFLFSKDDTARTKVLKHELVKLRDPHPSEAADEDEGEGPSVPH